MKTTTMNNLDKIVGNNLSYEEITESDIDEAAKLWESEVAEEEITEAKRELRAYKD